MEQKVFTVEERAVKFIKDIGLPGAIICALFWFGNNVYSDMRTDNLNRETEYKTREDIWVERMKKFENTLDKVTGTLESIDKRLEKLED